MTDEIKWSEPHMSEPGVCPIEGGQRWQYWYPAYGWTDAIHSKYYHWTHPITYRVEVQPVRGERLIRSFDGNTWVRVPVAGAPYCVAIQTIDGRPDLSRQPEWRNVESER